MIIAKSVLIGPLLLAMRGKQLLNSFSRAQATRESGLRTMLCFIQAVLRTLVNKCQPSLLGCLFIFSLCCKFQKQSIYSAGHLLLKLTGGKVPTVMTTLAIHMYVYQPHLVRTTETKMTQNQEQMMWINIAKIAHTLLHFLMNESMRPVAVARTAHQQNLPVGQFYAAVLPSIFVS